MFGDSMLEYDLWRVLWDRKLVVHYPCSDDYVSFEYDLWGVLWESLQQLLGGAWSRAPGNFLGVMLWKTLGVSPHLIVGIMRATLMITLYHRKDMPIDWFDIRFGLRYNWKMTRSCYPLVVLPIYIWM